MSEQQTQAASSPADVFLEQAPSFAEFSHYRQTGELPERFKPEPVESAPTDAPEKTVDESVSASETDTEDEAQEPPQKGSGAEKRIKQLLAEKKELQRKLEDAAKQGVKSDPPPAQAQQAQYTRPKPTPDAVTEDGKPRYTSYEDYVEELADWKAEQRIVQVQREQAQQAYAQQVAAKVDEARQKFGEDFDTIINPTAGEIADSSLPLDIKRMFATSDVAPEILHAIGSDPEGVAKLVRAAKADPLAAIRHIAMLEAGIKAKAEVSKPTPERDANGKFVGKEPAPEKKKTSAPPPPSPVSGGSSRAFDVSDDSLSNEVWAQKRNEDRLRRFGKL